LGKHYIHVESGFMHTQISIKHNCWCNLRRVTKIADGQFAAASDTYEHLDAISACFPWCTVAQQAGNNRSITCTMEECKAAVMHTYLINCCTGMN
jgi:hypothetical protein